METDDRIDAPRRPSRRSWIAFTLGAILLVAAAVYVLKDSADIPALVQRVRGTPPWIIALVLLSPLANLAAVTLCLHALQSRFGPVGRAEMLDLVASAWLLNHLPMRPGLIGRIGYHKKINAIRVRDSVESTIWSGVLALIANAALLAAALLIPGDSGHWYGTGLLIASAPTLALFIVAALVPRSSRLLAIALAWRSLDVLVWYIRYAVAFELIDLDLSPAMIALVSAVSQGATLIPFTGSGVGFREWGVGLSASAAGFTMSAAILADLINRAAETLLVIPVGLIATARVVRRWKRHRQTSPQNDPHHHPRDDDQPRDHPQQHPPQHRQR